MPWTKPNNDFTVLNVKSPSQEYGVFRVYKHYVADSTDYHRMVMHIISREEAAEGTEIIRDTTDTDKVTFRVFSRDRILLMDWSTDTAGDNLVDGNCFTDTLSESDWGIDSGPAEGAYTNIEGAIGQYLAWIQYAP